MKEKLLDSVEKLTNQKHINAIKKGMMLMCHLQLLEL